MSGLGDKLTGSIKEAAGKLTGNQELEAKGKAEQVVGNLKERADEVKDAVGKKVNDVLDTVKGATDETSEDKDKTQ